MNYHHDWPSHAVNFWLFLFIRLVWCLASHVKPNSRYRHLSLEHDEYSPPRDYSSTRGLSGFVYIFQRSYHRLWHTQS